MLIIMTSLSELNKKLKNPVILSPDDFYEKAEPLSTGLPALDAAVGIGGFPRGRIVEIYGAPSSCKSALAFCVIATAQKKGMRCYFADAEMTFLSDYAESLGVDVKKLPIIRGQFAETYFEAIEMLAKEKAADVVILDSLDACVPRSEMEAVLVEKSYPVKAILVSRFLRRLIQPLKESKMLLIILNQTRINVLNGTEYTTGGKGLGFYTSVRLRLKQVFHNPLITQGGLTIGKKIEVEIMKNKVGRPNGKFIASFFIGKGFSAEMELVERAISLGKIEKRGQVLWFGEVKLGRGANSAREFLEENEEVKLALELSTVA